MRLIYLIALLPILAFARPQPPNLTQGTGIDMRAGDLTRVGSVIFTDGSTAVTKSVTNGLISAASVASAAYVTKSVTNGILTSAVAYADLATNTLVTADITNGVLTAAVAYADLATNSLTITAQPAVTLAATLLVVDGTNLWLVGTGYTNVFTGLPFVPAE